MIDDESKTIYACPNCLSTDIEGAVYIPLNTMEVAPGVEFIDFWCPKCEEHFDAVETTTEEVGEKEKSDEI